MRIDPLLPLRLAAAYALPPRCPGCGELGEADHRFCGRCWSGIRFLGPPACAGCGAPFAYDRGKDARCAACLLRPPRHRGVFAATVYDEVTGALAVRLKHGGRIALADTMARFMARIVPEEGRLLVPVPLHRGRLWRRGFNQAALIADALSRLTDLPHHRAALARRRPTAMLRGLGRKGRARAVRGAFVVADPAAIRDAHVILVDDVYTTGATSDGCVAALLAGGAASVRVLCWARALPEQAD